MHSRTFLLSLVIVAAASVVAAQERSTTRETKQTTVQNPDGSTSTVTITGEVVRYEPGHTIVIRQPNNTEATYTLDSSLDVPADVQVGRQVTIVTQSQDGTIHIRKITTSSSGGAASSDMEREKPGPSAMAPSQTETRQSTTETRSTASSAPAETRQSTTTTRSTASIAPANGQTAPDTSVQTMQTTESSTSKVTTVSGTVSAFEPGQSITIVEPNRKTTTYTISEGIDIPQDVTVGKRVTVQTTMVSGKPVVKSVTTKTTTKKTHTKTVSPK